MPATMSRDAGDDGDSFQPVVKSPQKNEKVEGPNPMGGMIGAMRSFGQDASVLKKK
jgi:hypothetical protein